MTDNEIIKALECCADENNCAECPLKGTRFELDRSCENELMKASAELIKSKNAKIEELQHKIASCNSELSELRDREELKELEILDLMARAESEARQEFADRLKAKSTSTFWEERKYVDTEDIDNTLAELSNQTEKGGKPDA